MSGLKSVLLAIEHASLRRDELAKAVARVERSQNFARDQMAQLKGYAADTDARWTGSGARGVSLELVRHQYQFMERLQHAIGLQTRMVADQDIRLESARQALLATEQVTLDFTAEGITRLAQIAFDVNERTENIGARRLATVMERLLDDVSFDATALAGQTVHIDAAYVNARLGALSQNEDLSRYIL